MRTGRIFILLFTFISLLLGQEMNANTPKRPDFAYPKTVSADASKALAKALDASDGPAITRALLDYYLAQTKIDASNGVGVVEKIDSICTASSDPLLKAMLLTLQADIYSAVYSSSRWKYDSRDLPLSPLPADYNEWSGEQFRNRIASLVNSALLYEDALKAAPVKTYASVIDFGAERRKDQGALGINRLGAIYYPTLYDFVASQALELLTSNGRVRSLLSWGLLTRHDLYVTLPFSKYDPTVAKILEIYASLLKFHPSGSAPFINADIERLNFITSHVYTSTDDDMRSLPERKFELLRSLYEENKSSEYSGDILIAMPTEQAYRKWLYEAISHNLKSYPAYPRKNSLSNIKLNLELREMSVDYPDLAAPGTAVKINVSLSNVKSGKIYIYNVSSSPLTDRSYNCTGLPAMKAEAVIPVKATAGSAIPFSEDVSVDYTFAAPGNYIAIAVIEGVTPTGRKWYDKINVTRYALGASRFEKNMVWALDAMSGAPVSGAEISINDANRNSNTLTALGTTGADGSLDISARGNVYMKKDGDRFAQPVWVYSSQTTEKDAEWYQAASGYASLPLYHPGDSVDWMAIIYEYKGKEHRPVISKEVSAILRDASYRAIDTLRLTTDEFGRVAATFNIPKDCLSGRFCISIDNRYDPVSFMVSDYKLPTFRVILDPVEKDYPATGDVTLRGRVETYAGFPVGDARLTLNLSVSPRTRWWWNRGANVEFHTLEGTTDAEGRIEMTIPKDVLAITPIPDGIFSATMSALSPAGETQTASTVFSMGTRYIIRASVPANIDISAPTSAVKAQVVNYQDSTVNLPVNVAVLRDSVKVLDGVLSSENTRLDLSGLSSGKYEFRFSLADKGLADSVSQTAILYRPTDKTSPVPGTLLWYPTEKVTVGADGKGEWLYAVDCPTNLLVTVHTDSKIISREWVNSPEGLSHLPVNLPEGTDEAVMEIAVTGNYRNSTACITLTRDVTRKGIRFVTESFRDRLIPGSEETWTFRIVDESENGRKAAVVLDMYNTALDALASQSWTFNPATQGAKYYYSWNQSDMNARGRASTTYLPGKYLSVVELMQPDFNTYGLSLSPSTIRIRGTRMLAKSAATMSAGTDDLNVVREHKEEVMVYEAAAANTSMSVMADSDTAGYDAGTGAAAKTEMDEDAESENGSIGNETGNEMPFTFRDREVPLAFFKPMLTTDSEGRLSFTFTVPNVNTTWGFKALAYTDSLMSTTFSADVMANKPVMVQPNLPRFVRAGDVVTVNASVMNGSDSEQTVETSVEIFNAADGKTIGEYTETNVIAAGSSAVVTTALTAPTDAPFIGYRIKSSTDRFADGEQTLLPVLPAVSPVIDTYPFYIAPDEKDFSMALPKVPANARVTLQFCENPVWYVVTALPGLLDIEASTANEAAASIFSAAIATGLLRDNPVIAEAFKEWAASDKSDRTLTSMLERNEDLKQVLLASTPWMLDAKNDSERMSRLSLLFDEKTVNSTVKANIATLKKLVRGNGGWAWNSYGTKASKWATENVLLLFGQLRSLGYLPESADLTKMICSALGWLDSEAATTFRKYPKTDFTLYVYLRERFKDMKGAPNANSAIITATTQRIIADWKSASVFDKGIYARILADNSNAAVAGTILESLRQYSEYTPEKGMWWPSLDNMTLWSMGKVGTTAMLLETFATVAPDCQDIDRIRQWLILQKEAKDWGTSVTTSSATAAILSTSSKWVEPARTAKITVAGKEVEPDNVERMTGYFRTPLALDSKSKGSMKVTRESDSPSWGALFYLYTDSMTSVKAHACPELSIEKQFAINGSYTDEMKVGDKVTVTLTLRVDRDMDYVTIVDERPACYEPVEQLPTPIFAEGIYFYRENRDASTRLFIDHLPKGTYVLTYDMWVNNSGTFASGIATAQSQYAPQFTAHTSGQQLTVGE